LLKEQALLDPGLEGRKAKTIRNRWDIPYSHVAYRAGCHPSAVERWESTNNQFPLPAETTEALRWALRHMIFERALRIAVMLAPPDDPRTKHLEIRVGRPPFRGPNQDETRNKGLVTIKPGYR